MANEREEKRVTAGSFDMRGTGEIGEVGLPLDDFIAYFQRLREEAKREGLGLLLIKSSLYTEERWSLDVTGCRLETQEEADARAADIDRLAIARKKLEQEDYARLHAKYGKEGGQHEH